MLCKATVAFGRERDQGIRHLHLIECARIELTERCGKPCQIAFSTIADISERRTRRQPSSAPHDLGQQWLADLAIIGRRESIACHSAVGTELPPDLLAARPS